MASGAYSASREWPAAVLITDYVLGYVQSAALRAVARARVADYLADCLDCPEFCGLFELGQGERVVPPPGRQ